MSNYTLGKIQGLTYMQYGEYKSAVATFSKVELYNSNVSTMRGNGNLTGPYYNFATCQEEVKYTLGQMLLIQTNPTIKITPVQKN